MVLVAIFFYVIGLVSFMSNLILKFLPLTLEANHISGAPESEKRIVAQIGIRFSGQSFRTYLRTRIFQDEY